MFIEESGSNQSLALFYFYDTFFRCGVNLIKPKFSEFFVSE